MFYLKQRKRRDEFECILKSETDLICYYHESLKKFIFHPDNAFPELSTQFLLGNTMLLPHTHKNCFNVIII